jgi:hypothetical protein
MELGEGHKACKLQLVFWIHSLLAMHVQMWAQQKTIHVIQQLFADQFAWRKKHHLFIC